MYRGRGQNVSIIAESLYRDIIVIVGKNIVIVSYREVPGDAQP